MSTIKSLITGKPGKGRMVISFGKSLRFQNKPNRFLPLMFTPSEPQIPSRHERRNVKRFVLYFQRKKSVKQHTMLVSQV